MKKFDMMCLNNKIKDAMKNGKHNVGRLDKLGFESMIDELNNELSRPRIYGMITIVENCKKKNMDRKETYNA